jgi:hypothetical protein
MKACQSYMPDRDFCRDGFPQRSPCWGAPGTPVCCNEALCARLYDNNGGKPPERLYGYPQPNGTRGDAA